MRRRRGKIALAACEACRGRKVRCDGGRPRCKPCVDRHIECQYSTQAGESRQSALKSELDQLRASNSQMRATLCQLRHGTPLDVSRVLRQVRSDRSSYDEDGSNGLHRNGSPSASNQHKTLDFRRPSQRHGPNDTPSGDGLMRYDPMAVRPSSLLTGAVRPTNVFGSKKPSVGFGTISAFIPGEAQDRPLVSGMDERMFSGALRRPLHAQQLLVSLQAYIPSLRKGLFLQQSRSPEVFLSQESDAFEYISTSNDQSRSPGISIPASCVACAVAATSGQYVRDEIPSSLLDQWYSMAKNTLRQCSEVSIIGAAKASTLLGFYDIANKCMSAVSQIDVSVHLCSQLIEYQSRLSPEEMIEFLRVQRSIRFCKGLMQSTLGYRYEIGTLEDFDMSFTTVVPHEADLIQEIAQNVAVTQANLVAVLWNETDFALLDSVLERIQGRLRQAHNSLPEPDQTCMTETSHFPLNTMIHRIHLLHMGSLMLAFRRCVAIFCSATDCSSLSNQQKETVDRVLEEGIVAAQRTAQALVLLRQSSQVVRHCWITMQHAHVSGLLLIYHMVYLEFFEASEASQASITCRVEEILDVLDFCKKLDPVARAMSENLSSHFMTVRRLRDWLEAHGTQLCTADLSKQNDVSYWRIVHVFMQTLPGTSELAQALRRLVEHVSHPFFNIEMHDGPNRAERHFDIAVTSPYALGNFPDSASPSSAQTNVWKSVSSGTATLRHARILGSQEPLWWLAERSSETYTVGAGMLSSM